MAGFVAVKAENQAGDCLDDEDIDGWSSNPLSRLAGKNKKNQSKIKTEKKFLS